MYLKDKNIPFYDEVSVMGPNGYLCYYDFEIDYNKQKIIIEIDGENHMKFTPYFHREIEQFENCRKRDIYKHYIALKEGKKIFRIDFSCNNKIPDHIEKALNSNQREYFSTPSKYDWLVEGVKKLVEIEKEENKND